MIFNKLSGKYPFLAVTILICCFFLYQINRLSLNFPFHDDYWVILETIVQWEKDHSISVLFKQHNEQRILFIRSIAIIQYEITGASNFRQLIFLACMAVPVLIFLFYRLARQHFNVQNNLALLPIPILLCTYFYSETSLWAMCGLQHLWTLVFIVSLILLLKSEDNFFWLAIPLSFLTIYSSGNGIFILIAGAIVSYNKLKTVRFWAWMASSFIFLALYFVNYTSKTSMGERLSLFFQHIFDFIIFNLAFLGSALDPGEDHNAVMMCAFTSAAFLFVFIYSIYHNRNNTGIQFTLSLLSFIFLSAFVASLARYSEGGIYVSIESRYKIYSLFFFCVIYIFWIANFPSLQQSKMAIIGFIAFSFSYNIYTYWLRIPLLHAQKVQVLRNLSDWENGKAIFLGDGWDDTLGWRRPILLRADSLHIFQISASQRITLVNDLKTSGKVH